MSVKTVDIQEAQTHLQELVALVQEGGEVILVSGDTPVARLVPDASPSPASRIFDLHPGAMQMSEDFDAPLPDEFWLGEE